MSIFGWKESRQAKGSREKSSVRAGEDTGGPGGSKVREETYAENRLILGFH